MKSGMVLRHWLAFVGCIAQLLMTVEGNSTEDTSVNSVHTVLYVGGAIFGGGLAITLLLTCVGCAFDRQPPLRSKQAKDDSKVGAAQDKEWSAGNQPSWAQPAQPVQQPSKGPWAAQQARTAWG
ncbi:hypothetical protein Vafri_1701 [Volvox africanus]|nr:hypothetical protein Vafri_1701 [Volvox africanus]